MDLLQKTGINHDICGYVLNRYCLSLDNKAFKFNTRDYNLLETVIKAYDLLQDNELPPSWLKRRSKKITSCIKTNRKGQLK